MGGWITAAVRGAKTMSGTLNAQTRGELLAEERELRDARKIALQCTTDDPVAAEIIQTTGNRLDEIRKLLQPQQVHHSIDFSSIPPELQSRDQWVLWKIETRDGKDTKIPYQTNGRKASSTDQATWCSFTDACNAYDPSKYSGIGFVFSETDDLCGIDLDGCRDPETGFVADWAVDEVLRFASYTEVSPSLTGLKIWITANASLTKGRKKELRVPPITALKDPAVEVYTQGRYFAATGQVYKNYRHIEHRESELQAFLTDHWPAAPAVDAPQHDWRSDDAVVERARKYVERIPGAVSGSGGHNATFHVACVLVKGFALTQDQAIDVINEWNATCDPPWTEHELQHKIESASKASGDTGYLRNAKPERWDSINVPVSATAASKQVTPFLEGDRVRLGDRGNVGTIQSVNHNSVTVEIVGKDGVCTKDFPLDQVRSLDGSPAAGQRPPKDLIFHDAWKAAEKPRPMRECIIEGLLRRGEVGNIIAATKIGKSWFALMLLICVATGRDWLGRRVARGNVLLIDNELHEETLENRISAVQFAMKFGSDAPRDRFEYVACRGNWISIQDLIEVIPKQYPPGSLNLICIDAKYRLFGDGLEENSNDDQTTFHNLIDQFAAVMNCPIVLVHHATKGDQAGKAVTDIGSGGGSQSRTVDLHMVIRPHQQPELSVLEAGLRSFTKFEPITLRWNWPLWSVASDVEPMLPKNSKDSERYVGMKTKVLKYLTNEWQSLAKLAERCSTKKDRNPFADIVDDLESEGLIAIDENFIPKNSKTETTGVRMTSDKLTSDNCPESLSGRPD